MENKFDDENKGNLKISENVIEKIAEIATLEVEGVASLAHHTQGIKGIISKTYLNKFMDITLIDNVATIDISVNVLIGYEVPKVSVNIQKNVKAAVQNMTSIAVSKVNVTIAGVEFQEQN